MREIKKNSGQSLVEVLVALTIAALVILGIVKATTTSVKNAGYSQDQTTATSMAQKKMSEIIALKNESPKSFFNPSLPVFQDELINDQFCIKTVITDIGGEIPTSVPTGAEMAKIQVRVFWGEEGAGIDCGTKQYLHNYQVQTNVTN